MDAISAVLTIYVHTLHPIFVLVVTPRYVDRAHLPVWDSDGLLDCSYQIVAQLPTSCIYSPSLRLSHLSSLFYSLLAPTPLTGSVICCNQI
jgi:hypothetical protein